MKTGDKTAVGIDITQDRISIVMLRYGRKGPEIVKSAVVPMPDGAVRDGNVADPDLLAKTMKELKHRSGIRTKCAAVSLFARPAVMQIMDMPKHVPSNIRQFVNSEIKNCVVLPSRDITVDFCGISSARRAADKKVLVVAAESERMIELVRVCDRAGFSVELIEPSLLAYLGAVHKQKIVGKTNFNVLIAILQGASLSLCVIRNGTLDFVRSKELAKGSDSDDLSNRLADELSEVIKFYDIEVPENTGKWDVTVFADGTKTTIAQERVKSRIKAESLQIRTIEEAFADTPVAGSAGGVKEKPSPVAIGLAMNLLMTQETDIKGGSPDICRINLLPPKTRQTREAKKDTLVAVNVIAAVLLVMLLAINIFALLIERSTRSVLAKEKLVDKQDTQVMLDRQASLDARLGVLTNQLNGIRQIKKSHLDINWAEIFGQIAAATPRSVRITAMSCEGGSKMLIQGLALSNESVYQFVDTLEKSPGIASATLMETRERNRQKGLITYQIHCTLDIRSDKGGNVG